MGHADHVNNEPPLQRLAMSWRAEEQLLTAQPRFSPYFADSEARHRRPPFDSLEDPPITAHSMFVRSEHAESRVRCQDIVRWECRLLKGEVGRCHEVCPEDSDSLQEEKFLQVTARVRPRSSD